ncbi:MULTISPECIES: hypothetical protein [Halobacterium]|uniref:hypothetical protein n=1 Tax=Halobacterium TaxID=2239 RepID=UPI001E49148D|nr:MULTISPECIES: hypothetical protein [Halobacterium]MDL0138981.1 hypothetical protein [Halobacterium salinarum]UHH27229.1 hypothetical protein LT974_16435 [Halobacterium noricense]
MSLTVQEFLQRKGAVEMLVLLHDGPMTYSEIEPEIDVTSSTIIERRDDAAKLGLLTVSLGQGDVGTKKVHDLTDMGEHLTKKMAREGLISNYRKLRALRELVDEQTEEIMEWVEENPSLLLQYPEAEDGTIIEDTSRGSDTSGSTDSADDGEELTDVESNLDDSSLEHPENPSNQTSNEEQDQQTENTEEDEDDGEEQNTEDDDGGERVIRPSEATPDEEDERDASELSQGSLSDIEASDSDDIERDVNEEE